VLALVPFAVLVLLFLLLPGLALLAGSFQAANGGGFTLDNFSYVNGVNKSLQPFLNSLILSFGSMLSGGVLGVIVAQALVSSRSPRLEQLTITFSSVAANFAGVPLAFAYIATIGAAGLVTRLLASL